MNTLRLYGRSMAILIKSQLQYPLSFLMQTIAQLVMEGGEMLALILLIDRFDRLNQWGPGDLYFFFGLMSVSFYLTEIFGRGVTGNFPYMVRTGQLDTVLLLHRGRRCEPDSGQPPVADRLDAAESPAVHRSDLFQFLADPGAVHD